MMSKVTVYLINKCGGEYDDVYNCIHGVYALKENAEKEIERIKNKKCISCCRRSVCEISVGVDPYGELEELSIIELPLSDATLIVLKDSYDIPVKCEKEQYGVKDEGKWERLIEIHDSLARIRDILSSVEISSCGKDMYCLKRVFDILDGLIYRASKEHNIDFKEIKQTLNEIRDSKYFRYDPSTYGENEMEYIKDSLQKIIKCLDHVWNLIVEEL